MSVYAADPGVIRDALLSVSDRVYHFQAAKSDPPYIVWAEDGAGAAVHADNGISEQAISGTVDMFTLDPENLTLFNAVQEALDGVAAWNLNSIQYENDTGYTHYEWRWEVE